MRKNKKSSQIDAELLDSIMGRIEHQKKCKIFKIRIALLGVFSFAIFIALIPALRELQSEILQSGVLQFMSLLLSDSAIIITYWKEFMFSVLESLPIFGTIMVLGLVAILASSVKIIYGDINLIFIPKLKTNV